MTFSDTDSQEEEMCGIRGRRFVSPSESELLLVRGILCKNSNVSRVLFLFVTGLYLFCLSCGQKDPLTPEEGGIAVSSEPSGAKIYLDERAMGLTTPDTLEDVPAGTHTVAVVFEGLKSCPESYSVKVNEKQISHTHFFLFDTQHVVLGEEFTSTTCPPCFSSSLVLDTLAELHSESFVVIRYHVWWPYPGDDPFYLANVEENSARNEYYDNKGTPNLFLDGIIDGRDFDTIWEQLLLERISRESKIDLTLSNSPNGSQGTVTAQIISCLDFSERNLVIRFVITESEIEYDAPNGESSFHQVMRDMLPDERGERIVLQPDVKIHIDRDYTVQSGWNSSTLNIVVFIQDDDTREVLQAASAPLQ